MYETSLTNEQNLTILEATPLRLADLTRSLTPAHLQTPPEPGGWSDRDVLAHLRACAGMWGKHIVVILREDQPAIKAGSIPQRGSSRPTIANKNFNLRCRLSLLNAPNCWRC